MNEVGAMLILGGKRNILYLLFLLCTCLNCGYISAQDYTSPRIRHYTLEDGLSQVSIYDLIQDQSGFIWVATQDGLNRFDGHNFKTYKYNSSDSTSISSNFITTLLEDNSGHVLVGTIDNGLNIYNQIDDNFIKVHLEKKDHNMATISKTVADDHGNIWVLTNGPGLQQLTLDKNGDYLHTIRLEDQKISSIAVDHSNQLWVATVDGGIYHVNIGQQMSLPTKPIIQVDETILSLWFHDQYLFIGTEIGLYIYNQ